MSPRALLVPLFAATLCGPAHGAGDVDICYDYGCAAQARIHYSDDQLEAVRLLLSEADSAESERALLGLAIGRLYAWAGEQSPIHNDRGGDYADQGVDGRMDCIDHATSTTRLLRLLEARGWLRFHRVLEPLRRTRFVVAQHFSAVVEELAAASPSQSEAKAVKTGEGQARERFVIDSWYYDNGKPAAVLPLQQWLDGADPDVR